MSFHPHWRYKNTTLLLLSVMVFIFLADTPFVHNAVSAIGEWGYVGALITGIFVVFTFTTAPALIVLYNLADSLNIIELSILAGVGSVIGDFIIFSFFKDRVFIEFEPIITKLSKRPFMHIFHTPYFAWFTPVVGALIVASPLPDELGITLLSASKLKKWQFIILTFVLDALGIYIILSGIRLIAS